MMTANTPGEAPDEITSAFEARVQSAFAALSPLEQRMARFFLERKETVVLASAAQIAAEAGTSDATVVRTAQSLGFSGLAELREALLGEISGSPSPGRRLRRTLDEAGDDAGRMLAHVVGLHEEALAALKAEPMAASFSRAIGILAQARRRHVFGIGPSGLLANYAALQFNRIGLATQPLTATGVGLADQLMWLGEADAVMVIAYAPLYREVEAVLDRAGELGVPVVLISDSLAPYIEGRFAELVPVPRGRADHLAMHGATMVVLEAMIIALAARRRDEALDSLERFSDLRGSLDRSWLKRGVRKGKR